MASAQHHGLLVRVAQGSDVADAGALTAEAYLADRLVDPAEHYATELRDAERRAREATLLVAVEPSGDGGDVVVGTLTLAPYGSTYAEVAEPGELELRMLAVAPESRRHGVAEALVVAAMREVVAAGARRLVLSTLDAMEAARRLYARLGFVAAPERDWGHVEVRLRVHTWTPPAAPGALVEQATWRPLRVEDVGGWRVGLSEGLTRRANSALPLGRPADVEATLDAVEALYGAEGLPSTVRVCRAAGEPRLADVLDARGYRTMATTDVLVRDLPLPSAQSGAASVDGVRVLGGERPTDGWLDAWEGTKTGAGPALRPTARAIFEGSPAVYLTAVDAQGPVGVIRAAFAEDWVALSCLVVEPRARRRGLGRLLTLRALEAGAERGARRAFLQVEAANTAAATLYVQLGFQPAERYVYRVL